MQTTSEARSTLTWRLGLARHVAVEASEAGLDGFLNHIVIDSRPEPRTFRRLARPWQRDLADRVRPAVEAIGGLRPTIPKQRGFWFTLARGSDKTSFQGRLCCWLLAFARRRLRIYTGASKKEQACEIVDAMHAEALLNPWLMERLDFRAGGYVIGLSGSTLTPLSSDAPGAYGKRGDFFVLDEIVQWQTDELWSALMSGRQKRPDSVFVVITNAGLLRTWQHKVFELVKLDPTWLVYEAPGILGDWMSKEDIDRDRGLLPEGMARRMFDNVWIDPLEEGKFLTRFELEQCEQLGKELGLEQEHRGKPGTHYIAAIDYGPKKDRTVCCVGHKEDDLVIVDRMDVWQGSKDKPVPIRKVEEWIERVAENFGPSTVFGLDEYQMEGTYQKYVVRYDVRKFLYRGGAANQKLAETLRSLVVNRRIAWYEGCGSLPTADGVETLIDETAAVVVVETAYGYRIDHLLTKHDDRTVTLGMMALLATAGEQENREINVWFL